MIEIDGSHGEGGGQILRTALALSAITKKECRILNIRKGRERPGLAHQHLLEVQTLSLLCQGKLEGDFLGSKEIKFFPGKIKNGRQSFNIKVPAAESITLLLQGLLPFCLLSESPTTLIIEGGATDTFFSPTIDYFQYCFLRVLEKLGGKIEIEILKKGYYPEGNANLKIKIIPSKLKKINLVERGEFKKIRVFSGASEFLKSKKVAERQLAGIREVLGELNLNVEEKAEYYQTQCPGSQVCIICEFENTIIGTDGLGKFGKRAEDIGKETALELLKEQKSNACLDKRLADQILIYLALIERKSSVTVSEVTEHCKTNIWVIEKFLEGNFEIKNNLIKRTPSL
ncbi:MAG: RNA 3'-terminal phosphate cyclase [Candidatus Nealsonbacteria bacterium]|nr:RNA 3'-terminal phosphate cyclase [Candidatus Nealsonbacteria bacterium]